MKVREGYKMTELGEIPNDWEVITLKDVTSLIKDGTHNPPKRTEEGIPLLSAENVNKGKIVWGLNEKNISVEDYKEMHKYYEISKGDILMTIVGTLGRTAIVDTNIKFSVQRSVAIFKPEGLTSEYLYYAMSSQYFQSKMMTRCNITAQAGIYLGELAKMEIILPPLNEQQSIAEILSSNDALITKTDELIEKTKEVKQGLMQELLTKGIGHTEFKDSELGRIPKEWEIKVLGDLCQGKPSYGASVSSTDYDTNLPRYIRITDISETGSLIDNDMKSCILDNYDNYRLNIGEIVFARSGATVGKTYMYKSNDGDCVYAGYLIKFVPNENYLKTTYLFQITHSPMYYDWVKGTIREGAQPNINSQEYSSLKIALPPISEQQRITEILLNVDQKIEALTKRKQQLEEIKQGLMQDLLTGRVRVNLN